MRWVYLLICVAIGITLWMVPPPTGVQEQAWHLFAIFIATIFGVVAKPLPMGAIAILGLLATQLTHTLSFADAFSGFSCDVVWLVVLAFFIARGFVITGLGARIAYFFVRICGRKTLGLGYGLAFTELILAPAVPSVTARSGGIIYPILKSLAQAFGSDPHDGTASKMGTFLTITAFQATGVTSAMFLTAMAGNPLAAEIAATSGVVITWGSWALGAIVPGLLSLLVIPYLVYKLSPPTVKETPDAKEFAQKKLDEMGRMKKGEWVMLGTFFLLLVMWMFAAPLGVKPAITALVGVSILLLTNTLQWKEVLKEESAWDTLVWFSTLLTMAGFLSKLGLTSWFSTMVVGSMAGHSWLIAFLILCILYFYVHYFFAGNVPHIGAMYAAFLSVSVTLGVPALLAALVLGFISNLYGGITHYGNGAAPILFGSGYVPVAAWWRIGFFISIVNILIWLGIGALWWRVLGWW